MHSVHTRRATCTLRCTNCAHPPLTAGLAYSIARLSPAPNKVPPQDSSTAAAQSTGEEGSTRNSSNRSSSGDGGAFQAETEAEGPAAAVSKARAALLQSLLPATEAALSSYRYV